MERPTGPEHAGNLPQRCDLLLEREQAEHQRAGHVLEAAVGKRKAVRERATELEFEAAPMGLLLRASQGVRVGIEADDGGGGTALFQEQEQCARGAPDVERSLTRLERHLLEERTANGVAAEQPTPGIIEGQEAIPTCRGKVESSVGHTSPTSRSQSRFGRSLSRRSRGARPVPRFREGWPGASGSRSSAAASLLVFADAAVRASWNRLDGWLRQVEALRRAA
jgi:hypothetical protein